MTLFTEIGGYWLCLRVRALIDALGGSIVPEVEEVAEVVEARPGFRFDVLCRRDKSEPLRAGLVAGPPRPAGSVFDPVTASNPLGSPVTLSTIILVESSGSRAGSVNGSGVRSKDANARLLCKSSKLAKGRKSCEVES